MNSPNPIPSTSDSDGTACVARIVDSARWSPTVENCQEWSFNWNGRELIVETDETRGNYFGTSGNTARCLSLGFVLEHLEIASGNEGLAIEATDLELATQGPVRATLRFTESPVVRHRLQDAITARHTDRRHFVRQPLDAPLRQRLHALSRKAGAHISVHDTPSADLAEGLAAYDVAFMRDHESRARFIDWTRYSVEESQRTRDGVYCRSWNLSPTTLSIMKRSWLFECGARFGALRPVKREMADRILGSSLVVVSAPLAGEHAQNLGAMVELGKVAMSAWLSLAAEQYATQPLLLAALARYHAVRHLAGQKPKADEARILADIDKALAPLGLGANEPLCIFRIGRPISDYPRDWRSHRLDLENVFHVSQPASAEAAQ